MTEVKHEMKIGDEMEDGTIFAGYRERKPVYTTPADAPGSGRLVYAPLTYTFNEAEEYVRDLNTQKFLGHDDWRVPTNDDLWLLYGSRDEGRLKGTFNLTGEPPGGDYWSSTPYLNGGVFGTRFGTGAGFLFSKRDNSSLRCVRG